jgi:hypothetical protein
MYEIEDGITLPTFHKGVAKYPFRELEVGQSFFVPDGKKNRIASAASSIAKRIGNGTKFTLRSVDGGIRVWRIK